jgi:hypothetical protein
VIGTAGRGRDRALLARSALNGLVGLTLVGSTAFAHEPAASIGTDAVTRYVSRGQLALDGPALQPYAAIEVAGLTLGGWASLDLVDENDNAGEFTEVDIILGYGRSLGALRLDVGYTEYLFPHTLLDGTREVMLGLTVEELPVTPDIAVHYDFDEANGAYARLGVAASVALHDSVTLNLGAGFGFASAGYNDTYWGVDAFATNDLTGVLGLTWQPADDWSLDLRGIAGTVLDERLVDQRRVGMTGVLGVVHDI